MESNCRHEHLRFEDGSYRIICIDCSSVWESQDFSLKSKPVWAGRETRHDRFSLPRQTKPA